MNSKSTSKKAIAVLFGLLTLLLLPFLFACEADQITTNPNEQLRFSLDTLSFDTVFTEKGSTTEHIKVYNPSRNKIVVSNISLGKAQQFKLNINGTVATSLDDILINARDSISIFVQVYVDPNATDTPFLIEDSINFLTNTNKQHILLTAYGQNAVMMHKKTLSVDTCFTADLPIIVSDTLRVSSGVKLCMEEGTQVFFEKDAVLYVEGELQIQGTWENEVVLRGVRLDNMLSTLPYDKVAGQWEGIHFTAGSINNLIAHADIRNAITGIEIDSAAFGTTELTIEDSKIGNMYNAVIVATNAKLSISNSLLYNARRYLLDLFGGEHTLVHCTLAGYYNQPNSSRTLPSVYLTNNKEYTNDLSAVLPIVVDVSNTLVYGTWNSEIILDSTLVEDELAAPFEYAFKNCLLRSNATPDPLHYEDCIFNQDPAFLNNEEEYIYNFELGSSSAAIGEANFTISQSLPKDLNGNSRLNDGSSDIGCYEYGE